MTAPSSQAMRLSGHGITVRLPAPWEGRIYRRGSPVASFAKPATHVSGRFGVSPGAAGWAGELVHPVLHLATFALPPARGDFGTGAVERMRPEDAFIALLEYGSDCLGTPLYAAQGLPRPVADEFKPNALQRRLPGQGGYQRFFTVNDRALCLYVVLGSLRSATKSCEDVQAVLDTLQVAPR